MWEQRRKKETSHYPEDESEKVWIYMCLCVMRRIHWCLHKRSCELCVFAVSKNLVVAFTIGNNLRVLSASVLCIQSSPFAPKSFFFFGKPTIKMIKSMGLIINTCILLEHCTILFFVCEVYIKIIS